MQISYSYLLFLKVNSCAVFCPNFNLLFQLNFTVLTSFYLLNFTVLTSNSFTVLNFLRSFFQGNRFTQFYSHHSSPPISVFNSIHCWLLSERTWIIFQIITTNWLLFVVFSFSVSCFNWWGAGVFVFQIFFSFLNKDCGRFISTTVTTWWLLCKIDKPKVNNGCLICWTVTFSSYDLC